MVALINTCCGDECMYAHTDKAMFFFMSMIYNIIFLTSCVLVAMPLDDYIS